MKMLIQYSVAVIFLLQRQHVVIPTALPTVGVERADLAETKGAEVHVYAHPSKVVTNLQHPKEKVCVVKCSYL